jgi:hypothetical protein
MSNVDDMIRLWQSVLPLNEMSIEEKLQSMEAIWENLSA